MSHPTPNARAVHLAVTGGGTGGHTYPALTTIDAVRAQLALQGRELQVTWYGSAAGLEAKVAAEQGIAFRALATGKVRRSLRPAALARNVVDAFRVPLGILQATGSLARNRPDVVLSTGGYVSVPVGLAAGLTGRRLVMHEQITSLGLANRLLSRVARAVALSHQSSLEELTPKARLRATVTGNPVRPELLLGDPDAARRTFQLDPQLPLLYVTGGAQGSLQINRLITAVLADVLPHCQILHQCGPAHESALRQETSGLPAELQARYRLVPYISGGLADILSAADLVISRAGAGTLAELTAVGKPSILIPLVPTAGEEQRRNAENLADAGAAVALVGPQATAEHLREVLLPLLKDDQRRRAMADAARSLGRPDAAQRLAELVIGQLRRH